MELEDITSQVLARADQLMVDAPGRVNVQRIIDVGDVRILRAAREALTEEEAGALRVLRLQTIERLDGSVTAEKLKPKAKEKKRGLFGSLLATAADNFSNDLRVKGEFDTIARQAGVVKRLPAPPDLIDAAENWAVSYLVADRLDLDLVPLRTPWVEATITSE